jgi:uroporphyrinogen decarboxylase
VADQPLRTHDDLARLRPLEPSIDIPYVLETVRILARELPESVPLLAFAGAPFTVASYLIEGRPSRTYQHTKALMHTDGQLWHALMEQLVQHAATFIGSQLGAGARAFQVFDSWAGALSRDDYDVFVAPYTRKVFALLGASFPGVPGIHFGIGCDHLLESMYAAAAANGVGTPVIGLDWRTTITDARRRMGADLVVQGNLDPALVLAGTATALDGVDAVLADNRMLDLRQHPGHIFNLGHGVQPDTDPGVLAAVVDRVHESTRR